MKFGKYVLSAVVALGLITLIGTPAMGHNSFKKIMSAKFDGMKVSCNACHVDKQPKTERNAFGKLFAKEFKDMKLSATFKEKKGAEKKEYESTVMKPAFEKAFTKISAMTAGDLIKAGVMGGITPAAEE